MWYYFTASAFAFGLFFSWLAHSTAKTTEKKSLSRILFMVDAISFSTYLITALRLTPTLRDLNGYPVDVARFLEWITTCPSLILIIGEIAKKRELAAVTMRYDYVMLICGFMASITREPYSTYFSAGALACFVNVIIGLNDMFLDAKSPKSECKLDSLTIDTARYGTVLSWSCCKKTMLILVPLIFYSTKFHLISYNQGEVAFCVADIFAKVFLTLVLVNATVEQSQNERVDTISGIANEMEQELNSSDALLQRMMPKEVLEQLKTGKAPGAEEYESVT
jgi:bacteriorhodopsin